MTDKQNGLSETAMPADNIHQYYEKRIKHLQQMVSDRDREIERLKEKIQDMGYELKESYT